MALPSPPPGGGYGLVSGKPASIHPRPARPFDRDDAVSLCLLRHNRQLSTPKLVRPSGRDDLAEMAVAAGSQGSVPQEPVLRTPTAPPSAGSPDRPPLHPREQSSSMKNRKREICTSGTVRDEDGNVLIYSANDRGDRGNVGITRSPIRASILPDRTARHARAVAEIDEPAI